MAGHYVLDVPAGGKVSVKLRLSDSDCSPSDPPFGPKFDATFARMKKECDDFYDGILSPDMQPEQRNLARQAYAGRCGCYPIQLVCVTTGCAQVCCGASSSITTSWTHG